MAVERFFTADKVLLGGSFRTETGIIADETGKILSVEKAGFTSKAWERLPGILCPGLINAHCHTELSALKGKIPKGNGLSAFIRDLQQARVSISESLYYTASVQALDEMWNNGIVAVGDICNSGISIEAKKNSKILFRNFIEVFTLNPDANEEVLHKAETLLQQFTDADLEGTITPHAVYSVNQFLMRTLSESSQNTASIHFLESQEERSYLQDNSGPMQELFASWGLGKLRPDYDGSFPYASFLESWGKHRDLLLVHCTELSKEEIADIYHQSPSTGFVLCPGANAYISNKLPNLEAFRDLEDRVAVGTDSLASNDCLNIVQECLLLEEAGVPLERALSWATAGGATLLKLPDLGHLREGTSPGIVQVLPGFPVTRVL